VLCDLKAGHDIQGRIDHRAMSKALAAKAPAKWHPTADQRRVPCSRPSREHASWEQEIPTPSRGHAPSNLPRFIAVNGKHPGGSSLVTFALKKIPSFDLCPASVRVVKYDSFGQMPGTKEAVHSLKQGLKTRKGTRHIAVHGSTHIERQTKMFGQTKRIALDIWTQRFAGMFAIGPTG
jgi:hypothetical protein